MYDLIIVGGGPAGMTAAIYAARYKLNVILISESLGGAIVNSHKVENWPGIKSISGMELMQNFEEHVKNFNVEILEQNVVDIKKDKKEFTVLTSKNKNIHGRSIILASGTQKRKSGIKNEDKFFRKGISYCYTCDAPMYKDKTVAVIGGGNSACIAALLLTKYCPKVYMIPRSKLRGDNHNIGLVRKNKKIEIIEDKLIDEINGKNSVEEIILSDGRKLKIQGLFVEIGSVPSTALAKELKVKLDEKEYVIVDDQMKTNIDGVFAAGDITNGKLKQIITAAAQGAIAANSVFNYLRN
ncbi:MAG: FAD-dependent oxidoreductase [Candidatus Nanoarchaeia archaeon]|nr:FAD-dependent oxidoreductase [Candidatus Nanoarchaeia archaeon]